MDLRSPPQCADSRVKVQTRPISHQLLWLVHAEVRKNARLLRAQASDQRSHHARSRRDIARTRSSHDMASLHSGADYAPYFSILVISVQYFDVSRWSHSTRFGKWKIFLWDDLCRRLLTWRFISHFVVCLEATDDTAFPSILPECAALRSRCVHQRGLAASWWAREGIDYLGNHLQTVWAGFHDKAANWTSSR